MFVYNLLVYELTNGANQIYLGSKVTLQLLSNLSGVLTSISISGNSFTEYGFECNLGIIKSPLGSNNSIPFNPI